MSNGTGQTVIEVGSVVQIKSGGPVMTVVRIEPPGEAVCKWYDLIWFTERFPVAALKLASEPPQRTRLAGLPGS